MQEQSTKLQAVTIARTVKQLPITDYCKNSLSSYNQ